MNKITSYMSEYLPQHPSESQKIRKEAEEEMKRVAQYAKLEKSVFLSRMQDSTNKILGIPTSLEKKEINRRQELLRRKERELKNNIAADLRVPSSTSLDRLRRLRSELSSSSKHETCSFSSRREDDSAIGRRTLSTAEAYHYQPPPSERSTHSQPVHTDDSVLYSPRPGVHSDQQVHSTAAFASSPQACTRLPSRLVVSDDCATTHTTLSYPLSSPKPIPVCHSVLSPSPTSNRASSPSSPCHTRDDKSFTSDVESLLSASPRESVESIDHLVTRNNVMSMSCTSEDTSQGRKDQMTNDAPSRADFSVQCDLVDATNSDQQDKPCKSPANSNDGTSVAPSIEEYESKSEYNELEDETKPATELKEGVELLAKNSSEPACSKQEYDPWRSDQCERGHGVKVSSSDRSRWLRPLLHCSTDREECFSDCSEKHGLVQHNDSHVGCRNRSRLQSQNRSHLPSAFGSLDRESDSAFSGRMSIDIPSASVVIDSASRRPPRLATDRVHRPTSKYVTTRYHAAYEEPRISLDLSGLTFEHIRELTAS